MVKTVYWRARPRWNFTQLVCVSEESPTVVPQTFFVVVRLSNMLAFVFTA